MNTHDANLDTAAPAGVLFDLGAAKCAERASELDRATETAAPPAPRLRMTERHQGAYCLVFLDRMLPADHQVRVVWDYVCGLDLRPLLSKIEAVEGKPGRDTTDPR